MSLVWLEMMCWNPMRESARAAVISAYKLKSAGPGLEFRSQVGPSSKQVEGGRRGATSDDSKAKVEHKYRAAKY